MNLPASPALACAVLLVLAAATGSRSSLAAALTDAPQSGPQSSRNGQSPAAAGADTAPQGPPASAAQPLTAPHAAGLARFFDPATAPFIPIPEIDEDPYSGTTLGLIPTVLVTNDADEIHQIIAPDVIHNQYFGWGARARFFDYLSDNTQWSVVGGGKQRVESEFDGEYNAGLLREDPWSFTESAIYDRNGSPHFYGIGNFTTLRGQTNYTDQQKYLQTTIGRNLSHIWQLGYTNRTRNVYISPGQISGIPSIQVLYPTTVLRAQKREVLNRIYITRDTRNDTIVPTTGGAWASYVGAASGTGIVNGDLYSEVGLDGREFWQLGNGVLAMHVDLRYEPRTARTHDIPFWALSAIGGDESTLGGDQPLRGYGEDRFVDRNAFSTSVEYRQRIATINAVGTRIRLELTPFADAGRVFSAAGTDFLSHLHPVSGIGLRGIAAPFVVGYLDVGYGSEGFAIFTGLNYPF